MLYLRFLTGFWIQQSQQVLIDLYSGLELCIVWDIQNPVYYCKFSHTHILFRHFQPYCGICWTLCSSCICRTLPYSGFWYIYRTRDIFQTLSRHIVIFTTLCNARILRTLPYPELCHIQSFGLFRTWSIFWILFI